MKPSRKLTAGRASKSVPYLTGFLLVLVSLGFTSVQAATHTLQAITDFDVIDAGEVPFYRDTNGGRNVLAINAANEDYRSRYALATTEFSGDGDFYDITLTTFGELDGDCVYQVLVNGVVVGAVVNTPAAVDYEIQEHVLEDIYVPVNATIGVTAVAVSNGLIPENDAFAFARGRWQTLTLTTDNRGADFTPVVDLDLSVDTVPAAATGQSFDIDLTVSNLATNALDFSATAPLISVVLPDALSFAASSDCSAFGYRVYCDLPEIAAGGNAVASFSVTSTRDGQHSLAASVIADQRELEPANNLASTSVVTAINPDSGLELGAALGASAGGAWSPLLPLVLLLLRRSRKVPGRY
ncbi:MAG: DUF11 domain-containing protein [Gammaproteobacteria bacterium]|nr:DUF11 domain-containing protein [Gammaproteobacteria bacterium]